MRKTSVVLMLAMLLAAMLCATPARADVAVPDQSDEDTFDRPWPFISDILHRQDDEVDDSIDDDEDVVVIDDYLDDEVDEDFDGDGEVDELDDDELDDDELDDDEDTDELDDDEDDSDTDPDSTDDRSGLPLLPLAAGVAAIAGGAAVYIIRSRA